MQNIFQENQISGLSQEEAARILKKDGFNELPSQRGQNIFQMLIDVIREPMLLLLIGAGLIYLFVGEIKDALMLLMFVFVVVGITFYQDRKTKRALEALRNLSSPRALVIRDGKQVRIPGREVVRGDILILHEGDRVPADAVILSCSNLMADESLLTGESLPVRKSEGDAESHPMHPGGDGLPFVYSGTLIVQGSGIAAVFAIGINTEMGKIGKALESICEEETRIKKETRILVRNFAIGSIFLCAVVVIVFGLTRSDWVNAFLAGLTLSMSILPEELPVILLIFLSLGAWRISKRQVLTRNTGAIEMLGSATVLCVDKTGTITMNKMEMKSLFANNRYFEMEGWKNTLPEDFHEILEYSVLASQQDPFDPIEKEIRKVGHKTLFNTEHIHHGWHLVREYPLSKKLLALSHVWESPDRQNYVIAAKGAPESIADLCHFDDDRMAELTEKIRTMSDQGYRVLGVAKAHFSKQLLPEEQHAFNFEFVGLVGFMDPVRHGVKESLKRCYSAGVRVIMITGDYPGTAMKVASEIGLKDPDRCITGPELRNMGVSELKKMIKSINIFARVVPEQKLSIVEALKSNGEIVAMTGDGVNDSPALKSSHIGIAMGERGTDVARETSDLVLLNDDFSSIIEALQLGRRIFDNLKKAMAYTFAVHIPIAGMSLLPVLLKMPLMLLPAHIAFLELIIDPACSTVFEAEEEEKDIMKRPPRHIKESIFDSKTFMVSLVQGLIVLLIVFSIYVYMLNTGKAALGARTIAFASLVILNLFLIFTNLSWSKNIISTIRSRNTALWLVSAGAVICLSVVLWSPFLRSIFHFEAMRLTDLIFPFATGLVSLALFELLKKIRSRMENSGA